MESLGGPPVEVIADYRALVSVRVLDLSRFGDEAIKWMGEAELVHKTRLFYTDEVKVGTQVASRAEAHNGKAKGFVARSKSFTRAFGWRPSQAIRQFIGGDKTVCECEGLMHAVMYNALCDVLGPHLFDAIFPEIPIGEGFEAAITSPTQRSILPIVKGVRPFQPGDWVYILTTAIQDFRDAVQETGHGGAAGGWNLIYCGDGKFMGFGLSGGRAAAYTLDEIREKMVSDIFDHGADDDDAKQPAPVVKRRGSGEFSRAAASSITSFSVSSSSGSKYKTAKNRATIKNSIAIQFSRRLDGGALTAWVTSLPGGRPL